MKEEKKLEIMRVLIKTFFFGFIFIVVFAAGGVCQTISEDLKQQVDTLITEAYKAASAEFPCKIKAGGKQKMLRWQSTDKCLNTAYQQVDWKTLSRKLQAIREGGNIPEYDFLPVIESSLSAHALTYDSVFLVKEEAALLPLSNSILKFLPANSLMDLPVYDRTGKKVGSFAGTYAFEKMGEISGTKQRYTLFQYEDLKGKIQSSTDRLLLDSFGVPWKEAAPQTGFRLPADKLDF